MLTCLVSFSPSAPLLENSLYSVFGSAQDGLCKAHSPCLPSGRLHGPSRLSRSLPVVSSIRCMARLGMGISNL